MADVNSSEDEDVPERFRHLLKVSTEEQALRLKLYPDVSVIEESKIQCTICLKDVKHIFLLKKKSYKHFILQVVVCKSCMKFYGDGDFSADEDGDDKYCRWCGQGGSLYLCSKCPSAFCKKCIKQNLERKFILLVERDDWCCFVCEPKPLYKLRALSWAVDQHLMNEERKEKEAEKRREALKNTPKASAGSTRKALPTIDLSEDYFQAHADSTRLWLTGLTDKIKPDIAAVRFNDCARLLPSLNSPSDLTNLCGSLVNYVDIEVDALLSFREELIKGVQKLRKKFRRSQSRARDRKTEVSGSDDDKDNEESVKTSGTQNGDACAVDDLETTVDPYAENGDSTDAVVDSHAQNGKGVPAANDSSADMFGDDNVKDEDTSVGRPKIRVRNLSELIAPVVKKAGSAKSKPAGETPEMITLSSDDEPPVRMTKGKQANAKKPKSEVDQVPNPKALKKTSLKRGSKRSEDSLAEIDEDKTGSESTGEKRNQNEPDLGERTKSSRRGSSAPGSPTREDRESSLVENPKAKKLREKFGGKSSKDSDGAVVSGKSEEKSGNKSDRETEKPGSSADVSQRKFFSSSESEDKGSSDGGRQKNKGATKKSKSNDAPVEESRKKSDRETEKPGSSADVSQRKFFSSSESEDKGSSDGGRQKNKRTKKKSKSKDPPPEEDSSGAVLSPKVFTSSESEAPAEEDPPAKDEKTKEVEEIVKESEPSEKKIFTSSESESGSAKQTPKERSGKGFGKPSEAAGKMASSTPKVVLKTTSSEDSTSSSDPLSESSDDAEKKTLPKKVNRSYFSASGSDEEGRGKKAEIKKTKKKIKASSSSDSVIEAEDLLRKKKKNPSKSTKSKKDTPQPKRKTKKMDSEDEDYNSIAKLCDFKTLRSKRGHSSGSLTLSEDEDEAKEKKRITKKKRKKSENPEDKLEDFYDSNPEELKEVEMEDLDETFQREFSHISDRAYTDDLKGEFLQLSSSDEEKRHSSPEEEEEAGKKRKKKGPAPAHKSKEGRKGKKQYADKLMKMKIDSDSDDLEKGEKKYEEHKKRQAGKKDASSDDDTPVVKKKTNQKKRAASRKKMFSDSDLSDDEDESEKEETKKAKENGSGGDSDFDAEEAEESPKGSGSDSDSSVVEIQPKKRRRIRRASGSSSSDEDSDGGGRRRKKDKLNDSKGRKNIKKILKEDDLKQTTQAALKAEQERKKRIQEKQKLYNQLMQPADELSKHTELTELVLDFDAKTKEKLVVVDTDLVKKLKPHQAEGVKFMWDSCFESLAMTKKKAGSGCILAHCMGLGKSLQVVTLVHTLITHSETGVRKVMVVAPLSTVLNWVNEFDKWLKDVGSGQDVNVFHMNKTQASYRSYLLKDWDRQGGVLILGYNLLRSLTNPKARIKAAFKKVFQEQLVDPGPDVVICDEGHILKNEKTAINQCMTKLKTRRRIVLTGTPLQNNLVEYHCMVQFVKPNLLGTRKEFTNRFVNPITNGQFEDSTPHDVKIMKRRAHVLHTMLDGLVQRKDYNVLTPYLPPKYEYVIHLKLSDVQVKLYRHYLLTMVHGGSDTGEAPKGKRLFVDFQNLMWICLHPRTLLMKADKDEKKALMEDTDEEGSLKDFIDDDKSTSESEFKTGSSSDAESGSESSVKSKPANRKTRGQGSISEDDEPAQPVKQWWSDLIEDAHMDDIRTSSKLFLFFTILKYCEEIGDKLLVFSQSLYTLDIIEYFLDKIDVETQKPEEERCPGIKGFEGAWARGLDYFRLDGSSACENRESWCKAFNRGENRARLFLISTRAGGLGINLTGANRVIIFDASWNPSFDVQSLFRVYRFGQEKPCYIYRFLSKGTMEEKIYERQVAKLSTSLRVIDEHQIDRHFSHSALAELYMFDPEGSELQGTPVLPKDRLMAELLQSHGDIILSHHQHDSLLQNQEDQELTEEERKAAWTEFENEKNQVPQTNYSLGAMASLLVEIRTKLKMANPTWTDDQLQSGALQVIQRLPDFPAMAPYFSMFQHQMNLFQQPRAQGLMVGTNPMFPGTRMPTFQYPQFNNNQAAMLANMNAARMANPGISQNSLPSLNLQQLLMGHYANPHTMNSTMVANPKHSSGPVIQTVRSLQKVTPEMATSSTGTGTAASPVVLDDSDAAVVLDD